MELLQKKLQIGPAEGVNYPLNVPYCGNCTMPIEYCENLPPAEYEKCKKWLESNLPDEFARLEVSQAASSESEPDAKARQKRGGKGLIKINKKKEEDPDKKKICISRAPRGKKKSVTVVTGLSGFGIDLKVAAKFFGSRFACGSSVTGEDEIVIQGDFTGDLLDVIPEKWKEIDEDFIEDLGDQKR